MSVAAVGGLARIKRATELTPSATGFFLTESGALVTCWHVVNRDKIIGLTVLTRDGRVYPVREVLAVDTTNDLAILQVEGQGFRPLPIAPEVRQGAPVWVLGYPFPWYYMLTSGIVSGQYILANRKEEMELVEHHC